MIRIVEGGELEGFLRHIKDRLETYAEVIVCAPFIDDELVEVLVALAVDARSCQCGFRLITSRPAAGVFSAALPGHSTNWARTVTLHDNLHAKVYVAITRIRSGHSRAIVTSANLTRAALSCNVELGIEADSTSPEGRRILHQIHHFVLRLCA